MNWIAKYRLNPDWFFPTDESDSEKYNREEIFQLIKNHDRFIDSKLDNRDAKISHLVGDEYTDPLFYLNSYLDVLNGHIDMTMDLPQILIYFIEDKPEPLLNGIMTQGMIQSKPIAAQTIYFEDIEKMKDWVQDTKKEKELFVYLIEKYLTGTKFALRCATSPKTLPRIQDHPKRKK